MATVRPFTPGDISAVVGLRRVCAPVAWGDDVELTSYFEELFFANPWIDKDLPSLVHQEADGRITGFMGVLPRPMFLNDRALRVAVGTHIFVDPGRRNSLAGLQLFRSFLAGPQDLSLNDSANEPTRKVWEYLGGFSLRFHQLRWVYVIRPSLWTIHKFTSRRKDGVLRSLRALLTPFGRMLDATLSRLPLTYFRCPQPVLTEGPAEMEAFVRCMNTLRPVDHMHSRYDSKSLEWLIRVASRTRGPGRPARVLLHNHQGRAVGYYVYDASPSGIFDVLELGGDPSCLGPIFDHLVYNTWRQGGIGVKGVVDPTHLEVLSDRRCILHSPRKFSLAQTQDPEILRSLVAGKISFAGLNGERWRYP